MRRIWVAHWSIVSLVTMALFWGGTATASLAQGVDGSTTMISIDSPTQGQTVPMGQQIGIGGWAVDVAAPGGVDAVEVYLDGKKDEGGTLIGKATYGSARSDVAANLKNPAFTNVGFELDWNVNTSAGDHTAYVYVHSPNGWNYLTVGFKVVGSSASTSSTSGSSQQYQGNPFATTGQRAGTTNQLGMGVPGQTGMAAPGQIGSVYDPTNPTGLAGQSQYVAALSRGAPITGYNAALSHGYTGSLYGGYPYATSQSYLGAYPYTSAYLGGYPYSASYTNPYSIGYGYPYGAGALNPYGSAYPYGGGAYPYGGGYPYGVGSQIPPATYTYTGPGPGPYTGYPLYNGYQAFAGYLR